MKNLLDTYNSKLDKLAEEHKKALDNEREARKNGDEISKIYWNQAKGLLVAKMEMCEQFLCDIKSEMGAF